MYHLDLASTKMLLRRTYAERKYPTYVR